MRVHVISNTKKEYNIEIIPGTKVSEIIQYTNTNLDNQVLLCKVDNHYRDLNHLITHPCTIELLDMHDNYAWLVYQNSLILLYKKAVYDILGNAQVEISNSLNKGLYTTIKCNFTNETVQSIENRMKELVQSNYLITKVHLSKEEFLNNIQCKANKRVISSLDTIDEVEVYSLDNYHELFYGLLVPNTSYLKSFELIRYRNGILLRYPHISNPNVIPTYEDQKLLYDAFSVATQWEKLMGVSFVYELNEKIKNNEYQNLIMLQEALHEKKISDIADRIKKEKKRIILISGPSSSGKTSFAKRLCIQLSVIGLKPLYLGTDDYFVERSESPLDENGEKDFECIQCVDIPLFNLQMNELLNGKKVDIPTFDFIHGTKVFGKRIVSLEKNQPIVIEGIHALNEILTNDINNDEKFKIYISPFTSLNIDHHNRIPTTDARMLRRLVRDHEFRGNSAAETIKNWPKVRKGEDQNIFPYSSQADVFFNTNYIYELAVLKKYAMPLLEEITRDEKEYAEAQRMLSFLKFFRTIEDDTMISNNSILREFIGGSVLIK